jgi:hypothetical protein
MYWMDSIIDNSTLIYWLAVCMPLCAACKQPVGLAPFLALVQVLWVKCLCKVGVTYVLLHPVFSTFLLNNSYTTMQVEHTHTHTTSLIYAFSSKGTSQKYNII